MKTQRVAIGLTVINLGLLIFLLAQFRSADAQDVATIPNLAALSFVPIGTKVTS